MQLVRVAGGHAARAMRLSFVGELGWELHVPNSSAVQVYEQVCAAGSTHGLVNAGYRAIDSLSIEKGYPAVSVFVIDRVAAAIVRLVASVCLWALSCLNRLTFDLVFWHEGRP